MHTHRPGAGVVAVRASGAALALVAALGLGAAGCSPAPPVTAPPATAPPATTPPATPSAPAAALPPGTPAEAAPGQGTGAPAVPATCDTSTLAITLGPGDGAAGTVYVPLLFTNTGARPCTMRGFPGVSYVTGDRGDQVGRPAARDGAGGAVVTLAPKAVASARLAMVQVANFEPAACRPTPVRGLRVYPPDQRASAFVPLEQTGCAGDPPSPQLRIGTIKQGR